MKDSSKEKRVRKWAFRLGALVLGALVLVAVAGWIGWDAIRPLVMADAVTVYSAYTVEEGAIETDMSFSATINVRSRQSAYASADATVQTIFVEDGQQVEKDDKLIQMSDGEIVRAEIQGTVNEISVRQGDTVLEGDALIDICDLQDLEVTITVDEYDIEKISVGQTCTVTVLPLETSFEAQISSINRVSESLGSVAYYTVLANFTAPEQVLPGMQATVSMDSNRVEDAAVLDMNALAFDEENKPYVLSLQADGTYEPVYVEVGINDGMKAEIVSGLEIGDTVYAVSGTETPEAGFSIQKIYNWIVGENVVIRESGRQGQQGAMDETGGEIPAGMEQMTPPDGEMPAGAGQAASPGNEAAAESEQPEAADSKTAAGDEQTALPDNEAAAESEQTEAADSNTAAGDEQMALPDNETAAGAGQTPPSDGQERQSPGLQSQGEAMNEEDQTLVQGGEDNE